jgi:hypothetical protein
MTSRRDFLKTGLGTLALAALGCSKDHSASTTGPTSQAPPAGGVPVSGWTKDPQLINKDLQMIGRAFHNFNDATGWLPSAFHPDASGQPNPWQQPWTMHWRFALLPYLEHQNLYNSLRNKPYWKQPPTEFVQEYSAGMSDSLLTNYRVFTGPRTIFQRGRQLKLQQIKDGTSNTLLVVEAAEAVPWASDRELPYDPGKPLPGLGHPDRNYFFAVLADGSIRKIPKTIDERTLRNLITIDDGQIVNIPG